MKGLIVSTNDIAGGAARAAYRLHQGLKAINSSSQMLVQVKRSSDQDVLGHSSSSGKGQVINGLRLNGDKLPLKIFGRQTVATFSPHWLPDRLNTQVNQLNPDIINLHWISGGYLQIETLTKFHKPLVWTLHDMWAFTGGCHYNQQCDRYTASCGKCPQIKSSKEADLSRWVWKRKANAWQNLNLTVVTPSNWLAKCAQASSLFQDKPIKVIPYGLDLDTFRPIDSKVSRELLGLPQDKQLLLFTSLNATSDKRKGFHLLQLALEKLKQTQKPENIELVVVGASSARNTPDFGFRTHYLGILSDDLTLALTYSAVDAFVAPSIQDNLPNTVLESLACGTPCIAFDIGGMPDMINHQQNGYLAQPYQIEDLAQGITWVLEDPERYQQLAHNARHKTEQEFPLELQATRYMHLFNDILNL